MAPLAVAAAAGDEQQACPYIHSHSDLRWFKVLSLSPCCTATNRQLGTSLLHVRCTSVGFVLIRASLTPVGLLHAITLACLLPATVLLQTKMKSVLVDFLVGAGLKPTSIVSYNHLGNNDGMNLSAPQVRHCRYQHVCVCHHALHGQGCVLLMHLMAQPVFLRAAISMHMPVIAVCVYVCSELWPDTMSAMSRTQTFRSKEISKSNVVDDMVASNSILYEPGEHPDHTVVIKYVPYVGDSKRAMDEYTSEIFLGGKNTIVLHNTCEDSLLAAPIILDLIILAELITRIEMKKDGEAAFHGFHPVAGELAGKPGHLQGCSSGAVLVRRRV